LQEAAYAVDCCSDRYDLLVLGGVLGAAAILAFPLGFAVVLTQETRKNWKKFEHAQAEATHGSQSQEDFSLGGGQEGALRRSPSPVSKFPTTVSSRGSDDTGEDGGYQLNLTLDFFDDLWLFSDKSQFYEFNFKQLDEHFNFFVCTAKLLPPSSAAADPLASDCPACRRLLSPKSILLGGR
jgi:hypothetical protein